jgi:hypothetical protein
VWKRFEFPREVAVLMVVRGTCHLQIRKSIGTVCYAHGPDGYHGRVVHVAIQPGACSALGVWPETGTQLLQASQCDSHVAESCASGLRSGSSRYS